MADVASAAGVSSATVSRVLNSSGYVSKAARKGVMRAVRALGYRHNDLARSLITRRTNMIALLVGDIRNPYFSAMAKDVEEVANRNGYTMLLCNIGGNREIEIAYVNNLLARRVDGFIFAQTSASRSYYAERRILDVPVVVIDPQIHIPRADAVFLENCLGAMSAVSHLIELGHQRIAHISGPRSFVTAQKRIEGYWEALREHGLRVPKEYFQEGDYRPEGGRLCMKKLLDLPIPPTAVFAANDDMAIGAMSEIAEVGLSIPQDISVVGFDDIPLASLVWPSLTTIAQPPPHLGGMAMQMLADRCAGKAARNRQVLVVKPSLIVRKSTQRVPNGELKVSQ